MGNRFNQILATTDDNHEIRVLKDQLFNLQNQKNNSDAQKNDEL